MMNILERWSLFGQKLLKFFNAPWRVEFRFLFIFHTIMIPRFYTICLIFMIFSVYQKYMFLAVGILFVICCLFLIEATFVFQKFKDKRITKFFKAIWKPLQYVIGLVIAIWSIGEANTYVYSQLGGEIPSNYTIAVNAIASVFTLILILFIFSIIFFVAGNILLWKLQKSNKNFIVDIARSLAFVFIFTFLIFSGTLFEAFFKQYIGKYIIAHTIFYPNFKCVNIKQKYPSDPISIISNSDFALVYSSNDRNIYRVKCKE